MVYVHGGGGTIGSGKAYSNSSSLVHKGVVLVTINYRLGILGYLAHRLLSEEQGGISGNYQLMDMVQALKWVKAHIRGFGGDTDRVTVFGQSFGGSAMLHLMLSPKARGTYDSIISQSGGGVNDYATQASGS
jgi:para-nitrobenzyl esterase